jgi:hypothetical protein
MSIALVILQLATATAPPEPATASTPRPTIEFQARVRAKEVTVEQAGEARLTVRAEPALEQAVEVRRNQPKGPRRFRNLDVTLDARATLAEPGASTGEPGQEARGAARDDQGSERQGSTQR